VRGLRYLWAAFVARPLGMPVPPNFFGLAAFGLLGAFLNPGFWAIGAGLEVAYLFGLSRSARFRAVVDAGRSGGPAGGGPLPGDWDERHRALVARLAPVSRQAQVDLEARCAEIVESVRAGASGATGFADGLAQLAWMHLKLLAAREALERVLAGGAAEAHALAAQEAALATRLAAADVSDDLRRTLEQQAEVIRARRQGHAEAGRRRERVQAELERIRQQVSLVREQALLATDEATVAGSVDALSASLNEANRWLSDQQGLLGDLEELASPPPAGLLGRTRQASPRRSQGESA
jgi:hypothetical protein